MKLNAVQVLKSFFLQYDGKIIPVNFLKISWEESAKITIFNRPFKVDWTFELLWDPLLTISPNLVFWKQLTVRSLHSK